MAATRPSPSPARVIELPQAAMGQAHLVMAGQDCALARIVAESQGAPGEVVWRGVLTSATIHALGSLSALAAEHGAPLDLTPQGLDERETAFLEDFRQYGPGADQVGDAGAGPSALMGAAAEAAFAAWQMRPRAKHARRSSSGGKAVIIGAYGGDHVGDAAILGGVLQGLNQSHGVTAAEVMSHRPEHTGRLAQGLNTPVTVSTRDYTAANLTEAMRGADLLAIAGGPLMDLPRVLTKHLAAAHMAKAAGIPFIIDRVGVGPFRRDASRWAARRLLSMADRIALRTAGSAQDPVMQGLAHDIRRDPAFDYLATRKTLDRTTGAAAAAERLLQGTDGRALIGVNLRPLRHRWNDQDFSRKAETAFFDALASVMQQFADRATFVFFPMNPIEYGMSDLASALRLRRMVGGRVDLRVWEADPDVDDVLWLLRRLHGVMAMRFHAAIFALSQDLPTIGFDYYPGKGGKVEELFADLGRSDDGRRLDRIDPNWLSGKLSAILSGARICAGG